MNKRKLILPVALAFGVIMLFMLLGGTVAYLTDTEKGVNVITIGKVGLALTEPSYTDNSKVLSAGDSVVKNPLLTNSGTKDEFVFIEVAVPKRNVTLLYEEATTIGEAPNTVTHKEGTPTVNNYDAEGSIIKKSDEIYKIIADGRTDGAVATYIVDGDYSELGADTNDPKTKPQLDFSYNKGSDTTGGEKEGWIYLSRELDKPDGEDVPKYDYYYFGYNKKLSSDHSTIPLFDRIQLKSFIDEEINSTPNPKANEETKILITGYGIQADSLGIPDLDTKEFLNQEDLTKVFHIVQKKG